MAFSDVVNVLDARMQLKGLRKWERNARSEGERQNVQRWADGVERKLAELLRQRDSLLSDLGQAQLDLYDAQTENEELKDELAWLKDELAWLKDELAWLKDELATPQERDARRRLIRNLPQNLPPAA